MTKPVYVTTDIEALLRQEEHAARWVEKAKAMIIAKAEADGYDVMVVHDEVIVTKRDKQGGESKNVK